MKLELLVSQSGKAPSNKQLESDSPPLIVQCLVGGSLKQKLNLDLLETLEISLHNDILRALQLKRKIDEPFLESCFEKWRHSLGETEWDQHAKELSILALIAPPLGQKRRELLVAIWGDVCLLEPDDQKRWCPIAPTSTSQKEAKGSFYRLLPPQRGLFLAICPSALSSQQLKALPIEEALAASWRDSAPQTIQGVQSALGDEHTWCLVRAVHLSRWSFAKLRQNALRFAGRCAQRTGRLPLSRKKITTITTGILLSFLCTFSLLIYTKRTKAVTPPSEQKERAETAEDLLIANQIIDKKGVDKRFQPYSAWISWLQRPLNQRVLKDRGSVNTIYSPNKSEDHRGKFGERRGKIVPSETLSLQVLEEEIQRDLANLQRHRETLAQIAKSQGQEQKSSDKIDPLPSLNWFEEEQKRSEQHLLMARSSLEKLSRRYGELSSLASIAPERQPEDRPETTSNQSPAPSTHRSDAAPADFSDRPAQSPKGRIVPLSSLTTLRQRLHFPLADWELPIIEQWIDQITGWDSGGDDQTS